MNSLFRSRFARTMTVTDSTGSRSVRGFVQAERLARPEAPTPTPAGRVDERRYLLILPALTLTGSVTVTDSGVTYRVLRYETVAGDHIEAEAAREEAAAT